MLERTVASELVKLCGACCRPISRLLPGLVCVAGILLFASPASSDPGFELNDETWQGSSSLLDVARDRLGTNRVVLAATLDWAEITSSDAILVLHPESSLSYEQATAFMTEGGRIALIDDYGAGAALLSRFHITRVSPPRSPATTLRENLELPIAVPATGHAGKERGRHPVVDGIDQVMTNHPTALSPASGVDLTPVLELPARDGPSALFALIGVIGDARACGLGSAETSAKGHCGRLFVMGDPSVFINLMLRYPGNRRLAGQLVSYLVEDDSWGERGGRLFVLTNRFRQTGTFGNAGTLRGAAAEHLANAQTWLAETHDRGLPGRLALGLAVLAAAAVAAWAATRVAKTPRRSTPRYARAPLPVSQGGLAGRAAVLSAPTTHRTLAALELKLALEEQLRHLLGLRPEASFDAIIEGARSRSALTSASLRKLEATFQTLLKAESAVLSSAQMRMTKRDVAVLHQQIVDLIAEVKRRTQGES